MSITLKNVHISGAKVGIKTEGPVRIDAENVTFDNVETPWDTGGQATGSVRGSKVTNDPKFKAAGSTGRDGARLGWQRPKGPPLPLFCPSCKSISPSQNHVFGGAYWQLWNNEEQCPVCAKPGARLAEGVFDLTRDAAIIISAPEFTYAMLKALSEVSESLSTGTIDSTGAVKQIEQISPSLGAVFGRALKHGPNAIMFLMTLLGCMYARDAVEIGKEQVKIGQEQVQLAKDANLSADATQEKMLEALRGRAFVSDSVSPEPKPETAKQSRAGPPERKSPTETGSVKLKANRKPKAREVRRKVAEERRRVMSGKTHSNAPSIKQ